MFRLKRLPTPKPFLSRNFSVRVSMRSFMTQISPPNDHEDMKITVVGSGQVGLACAYSLLTQKLCNEIALVDVAKDKLKGELLDLKQGIPFVPRVRVVGDTDFAVSEGSKICIIAAGVASASSQTSLQLLSENTNMIKGIVEQLLKYSPDPILIVVTNPVDVLTHAVWKMSGRPVHTVIGSGTNLATAKIKYFLSQILGVNPNAIQVWIIGEHGDASVPVWSNFQVAGVSFKDVEKSEPIMDREKFRSLYQCVLNKQNEIIKLKGYSSWAVGLSVTDICKSIVYNSQAVHAVSTLVQGFHDVKDEVFLSLPCVIGSGGVTHVVPLVLSESEQEAFSDAAIKMYQIERASGAL